MTAISLATFPGKSFIIEFKCSYTSVIAQYFSTLCARPFSQFSKELVFFHVMSIFCVLSALRYIDTFDNLFIANRHFFAIWNKLTPFNFQKIFQLSYPSRALSKSIEYSRTCCIYRLENSWKMLALLLLNLWTIGSTEESKFKAFFIYFIT